MSDLQKKIATAVQELYLEKGIEGVSMRKVAERVGVSAPALYRYYKNKSELLNEIVVEGLKILEDYLRPALEADTPYERLQQMIDNYLNFALEQPRYFDFAFTVPTRNIDRFPEEIAKNQWDVFRVAVEQIDACMDQGIFQRDDPMATAITVWAEVHGLVTLYRMERFDQNPEQFMVTYRRSVSRLLNGLRP